MRNAKDRTVATKITYVVNMQSWAVIVNAVVIIFVTTDIEILGKKTDIITTIVISIIIYDIVTLLVVVLQ